MQPIYYAKLALAPKSDYRPTFGPYPIIRGRVDPTYDEKLEFALWAVSCMRSVRGVSFPLPTNRSLHQHTVFCRQLYNYLRFFNGSYDFAITIRPDALCRLRPAPSRVRYFGRFIKRNHVVQVAERSCTGRKCAICLRSSLTKPSVRLLAGCRHEFHRECLKTWLGIKQHCPICREFVPHPMTIMTESQFTYSD
jgi:hypothetical protein